jgi:hypothetical protein
MRMMLYTFEVTGREKRLIQDAVHHFPRRQSSRKLQMEFEVLLGKIEKLQGTRVPIREDKKVSSDQGSHPDLWISTSSSR